MLRRRMLSGGFQLAARPASHMTRRAVRCRLLSSGPPRKHSKMSRDEVNALAESARDQERWWNILTPERNITVANPFFWVLLFGCIGMHYYNGQQDDKRAAEEKAEEEAQQELIRRRQESKAAPQDRDEAALKASFRSPLDEKGPAVGEDVETRLAFKKQQLLKRIADYE